MSLQLNISCTPLRPHGQVVILPVHNLKLANAAIRKSGEKPARPRHCK